MTIQSHAFFQESPRDFRTEIPNVVFELLESGQINNSDFILYTTYRRIAGENGACWVGTRGLEKKTGLSHPTIKKSKTKLSSKFAALNGKSLIEITPCNRQKEQADTVMIIDIWQENHEFFKKRLTCENSGHTGVKNEGTRVCKNMAQKKEPYKKEPYKNPPPSPPIKKSSEVSRKEISLRSEEEELSLRNILKNTVLSDRDKKRLIESKFSIQEIKRSLEISKTQTIKKSLMGLLLQILENPDKWEVQNTGNTPNQQKALNFNNQLSKVSPKLAKENEKLITQKNILLVPKGKGVEQLSLLSSYFLQDLKEAHDELNKK